MKKRQRHILQAISAAVLLIFMFVLFGLWNIYQPVSIPASAHFVEISLPKDASVGQAIDSLVKYHVLSSPFIARCAASIYAAFENKTVQSGRMTISKTQTQWKVLLGLFQEDARTVNVTFPEGIYLKKYASIISEALGCDSAALVTLATSDSLLEAHHISARSVEGYLAPDTYNFFKNATESEIITRLLKQAETIWDKNFAEKAKAARMTKNEVLTLASIVEAETPIELERRRVSGVYHNRLKRGMKLQADPTVQFALGGVQRRLLFKDLEVDSPYNTYRYAGLPPAPINSPGKASIEAAIEPEKHNFLYFVAAGGGVHKHVFSETSAQHEKAVAHYRATR